MASGRMQGSDMGTRVNYEITNEDGKAAVVLYANCSHSGVEPDRIFVEAIRDCRTLSTGLAGLLAARYPWADGNHRAGDPIFTLDTEPGDREYVIRAQAEQLFEGAPQVTYFTRDDLDGTVRSIDPKTFELVEIGAPTP